MHQYSLLPGHLASLLPGQMAKRDGPCANMGRRRLEGHFGQKAREGPQLLSSYIGILRLLSRDGRLYLVTSALLGLTYWGGVFSVVGNLYLLRLGYGPEFIGLFNGAGSLGYAFLALPAGALGHRWGTRRTVICGLILSVAAGLLLPMSEVVEGPLRDAWLLATYLAVNAGLALYLVNGNPYLMAVTGPEDRNHAFSVSAGLYPLAAFVGSLAGGLLPGFFASTLGTTLDQPAPYRYPLIICAVLLAPGIIAMLAAREAGEITGAGARAKAGPAPVGLIAMLAITQALRVPGEAAARTFFNVYLDAGLGASTSLIGGLSAIGQLVGVPAALFTPLLIVRWGINRTYLLASLATAVFLIPMGLLPHWAAAGLGFTGEIAATSVAFPCVVIYAMVLVPPAWRPTMSAAIELSAGIGFLAASLGGGYIIAFWGYPTLFLMGAALAFLGTLLFWAIFRVPRGELAQTSGP